VRSQLLRLLRLAGIRKETNGFGLPAERLFEFDAPWIASPKSTFRLRLRDRQLRESGNHFIRFDLYPLFAPSHKARHHGFWDIPTRDLNGEETLFSFRADGLVVRKNGSLRPIRPVWRSDLPFLGYAMLHVSLWDTSFRPPRQEAVKSSMHIFWQEGRNLPLEFVFVSLTQRCNLSCPMCMRHSLARWEDADISPPVLDAFLESSSAIYSVFLGGVGEPLLFKGLEVTLEALKKRMPSGAQVGMNTNGLLLDSDRAARLLDLGLDWLCFSLDGARKETFERIRTGGTTDNVAKAKPRGWRRTT
jgi:hypothetical protein